MTNSPQFETHSKHPIQPLPPPPGVGSVCPGSAWPVKLNSAQSMAAQSMAADRAKAEATKPRSTLYAVRQQGPLTYFDFYFEDPAFAQTARLPVKAPPVSLNRKVAIAVGVVSVAVASGLVIGETVIRSEVQADKAPAQPTPQPQSATSGAPTARVVPERLETERSLPLSPASSPAAIRSDQTGPSRTTTVQTWRSLQQATVALPGAIATPERLSVPPQAATPDSARVAGTGRSLEGMQVSSATAKRLSKKLSKKLPASSTLPLAPQPAIGNAQALTPQASRALNPASESPVASKPKRHSETLLKAAIAAVVTPQSSVDQAAVGSIEQSRAELQSAGQLIREGRPTQSPQQGAARENAIAPATHQPASEPVPTLPQRLQDYLRPPTQASTEPAVNLLPLTATAAAEASAAPQIGPFKVRQVTQPEYQKEWLASNKMVADPAIAYAFPAYGFIDYQRQMIIVLGPQPDPQMPLQSQTTTVPRS